jgi:putative copper resistance protein D
VKDLNLVAIILATGLLYAAGFLVVEVKGVLTAEGIRLRNLARFVTLVWFVTVFGEIFTEVANLLGLGFLDAFNASVLRSFMFQTSLGRDFLFQILMGFIVLVLLGRVKKVGGICLALLFTLLLLIIPIFHSHASSAGNHGLAIGALIFHVLFVSLWVGGVIGLIAIAPHERERSVTRFSSLALWCAIIVGASGVISAWTRLNFLSAWNSLFGVLVGVKIALFIVLVFIGSKHRKYIMNKLTGSQQLFRLLVNESLIMIETVCIGGLLSTTAPPISKTGLKLESDQVLSLTGISMPDAPNLWRVLSAYVPDATIIGVLLLMTALYVKGVLVLSKRGDKWPVGRTVAFALGVAGVDFATSGGLGVYAHFAFSYHMVAHMVLGMIAPIGFVLSAPITLALRTLPQGRTENERGIRGTLIALIHSRYMTIMTNPIVALAIFDGSLFALYLTPLFGSLMKSHSGHLFMDLHFLLAGYLFFYVIIGIDPNPRKIPHIVRIIILFAAMSIHAFFSITLLSTSTLIDGGYFTSLHTPWITNLLTDQHTGGALGWAMGEIPILIALIATFIQWVKDDTRESKRTDRASDRAAAMGEEDELSKYNKYLAELNRRDER